MAVQIYGYLGRVDKTVYVLVIDLILLKEHFPKRWAYPHIRVCCPVHRLKDTLDDLTFVDNVDNRAGDTSDGGTG